MHGYVLNTNQEWNTLNTDKVVRSLGPADRLPVLKLVSVTY